MIDQKSTEGRGGINLNATPQALQVIPNMKTAVADLFSASAVLVHNDYRAQSVRYLVAEFLYYEIQKSL